MTYKLIAIDLDGTLLDNKKLISNKSLRTLKKLYSKGVHITLATGRNQQSTKLYLDHLGIESTIIANNGAIILYEDGEVECKDMPWEIVREVLQKAQELGLHYNLVSPKQMYYYREPVKHEYYYRDNEIANHSKVVKYDIIQDLKDLGEFKDKVLKLHIIDKKVDQVKKFIEEMPHKDQLELTIIDEDQLEISHKEVSKGIALEMIAKHYGVAQEETIAIGDSGNDLSMIKCAGLGIAMGNAGKEIKESADLIIKTNEEDGVATVLEEFIAQDKL